MGGAPVCRLGRGKLLLLEVARVARWRANGRSPAPSADGLLDVRLRDGWIHDARSGRVVRVEVARPDPGDGRSREPGVHRRGALVGRLGVRGQPGPTQQRKRESGDEPEPTWASHHYILPRDLAKAGARTPIALT
jgi:hypothetical protein